MTSTKTNYKLPFFFAMALALIFGSVAMYILSKQSKYGSLAREQIAELEKLKERNAFLSGLSEADELIILDGNYEMARQSYAALDQQFQGSDSKSLSERINQVNAYLASKESDADFAQFQMIIRTNQEQILKLEDRLKWYENAPKDDIDSLRIKMLESAKDSLSKRIVALNDELSARSKELGRKQAVQVLSFKNDEGKQIHYLGDVSNGKANGGGVGIWSTGSIYRGEWRNNQRHGKGTFEWSDGMKYDGDFLNDIREGEGTYYWPSGEKYVGEWKKGKREGFGILYDKDGNIRYEGSWKEDKPLK
jgi:hypothetical protein